MTTTTSLGKVIVPYVESGFSGLWVVSPDLEQAQSEINKVGSKHGWEVYRWDLASGITDVFEGIRIKDSTNPVRPFFIDKADEKTQVVCLHNYHRFLGEIGFIQNLQNALVRGKGEQKTFIILSHGVMIPPELDRMFTVIDHPLPTPEEIWETIRTIDVGDGKTLADVPVEEGSLEATRGLTLREAEDAFSLSLNLHGKALSSIIWEAKTQAVRKKGFLELHRGKESFRDLGGLEGLKTFCRGSLASGRKSNVLPRGILLLGVPGTGKSAFAKSLGNETGRPVLLMDIGRLHSKYVGESLPPWEEVIIFEAGYLRRINISDVPDDGFATFTCSDTKKFKALGCRKIIHEASPRILKKIILASGREITVTEDHSLFSVSSDWKMVEIQGKDITPGTSIAIPNNLSYETKYSFPLNIPGEDEGEWVASVEHLTSDQLARVVGTKSVNYYKKAGIKVSRLEESGISYTLARPSTRRSSSWMDITQKYTPAEEDCRILGFWLANGDVNKASLRLSINREDEEEVLGCLTERWLPKRYDAGKRGTTVLLKNGATKFYRALFGKGIGSEDCYTKRLPAIVLQLPDDLRAEVLSAYLCSDGFFGYHGIEVTTSSRGLAGDVLTLLATFGIMACVTEKDGLHRVRIQGTSQLVRLLEVLPFSGYSRKKDDLRKALEERDHLRKERVCSRPETKEGLPFAVDTVVSVEDTPYDGPVYDLSVPIQERFVSGFGGVWVHNSESNLRQALQMADAMSPCVLFIDEVEKALSGVGSDGDSGVSTRVFGTMLTYMNDHETDVYIVCTANDVSKLPPEFSRAERFDAVFFLDLPTQEEREEIWNIHKKGYGINGMTLSPPYDDAWTGAEIRSCCRLSALLEVPLSTAADYVVPVSVTAAEKINALREWCDRRVLDASTGKVFLSSQETRTQNLSRKVKGKAE